MPQREGPSPEIFIIPAGQHLYTISWHELETPYKRSEARDKREAIRVDDAYALVWCLIKSGYSIHSDWDYEHLEARAFQFVGADAQALHELRRDPKRWNRVLQSVLEEED